MPNLGSVPDSWFVYDFPLAVRPNEGPSGANYSSTNVAPMIEFFANVLGKESSELELQYENHSAGISGAIIAVRHPGGEHLPAYVAAHSVKSPELDHYERSAKRSKILKLFQDNSPAGIEYFQD